MKVYFVFQDGLETPLDVFLTKDEAHSYAYNLLEADVHLRPHVHAATYELV